MNLFRAAVQNDKQQLFKILHFSRLITKIINYLYNAITTIKKKNCHHRLQLLDENWCKAFIWAIDITGIPTLTLFFSLALVVLHTGIIPTIPSISEFNNDSMLITGKLI